jgi:hypothetical protein
MRRFQRSEEFEHYRRTMRCPNGDRYELTFIEGTGQVVENLPLRDRLMLENPLPKFDERIASLERIGRLRQLNHARSGGLSIQRFRLDSMFACATCGDRWPVFVQPELKIVGQRETGRTIETLIRSEKRRLDQTQSSTDSTFTLESTQEWVERIEVGLEQLTSREQSLSANAKGSHGPLEISAGVQERITENHKLTHSVMSQARRTTTQTRTYELPAGKVTVITIFWKQVWHEYVCASAFRATTISCGSRTGSRPMSPSTSRSSTFMRPDVCGQPQAC